MRPKHWLALWPERAQPQLVLALLLAPLQAVLELELAQPDQPSALSAVHTASGGGPDSQSLRGAKEQP
ncbi:hypothetical protein GCM10027346_19000 [Hymenobacter seoulensis]